MTLITLLLLNVVCGSPSIQGQQPPVVQQQPPVVQKAIAEHEKGNFKEAALLYQDALDHPPPEYGEMPSKYKSYLYTQIGNCFANLDQYEEAIAALNKGISFNPNNAAAYSWLGFAYHRDGKFAEAVASWQKAIELDPNNCGYYSGLAVSSSRTGQFDVTQQVIDGSRGKTCADEDQRILKGTQALIYLAKRMYVEAHNAVGEQKLIGVDLRVTAGAIKIGYLFLNGPAQLAGLEVDDAVESVNEHPIKSVQELVEAINAVPFGSTAEVRVNRNGCVLEKHVIVGIPANLPELAAAANKSIAGPGASRPSTNTPADSVPDTAAPALVINRVVVKPPTVKPGERFIFEVSYTATAKGTISFSYTISSGERTLFKSPLQTLEGGSREAMLVTKTLTAREPGKYKIRVQMSLDKVRITREVELIVER